VLGVVVDAAGDVWHPSGEAAGYGDRSDGARGDLRVSGQRPGFWRERSSLA
jgi:hypothetical protein